MWTKDVLNRIFCFFFFFPEVTVSKRGWWALVWLDWYDEEESVPPHRDSTCCGNQMQGEETDTYRRTYTLVS